MTPAIQPARFPCPGAPLFPGENTLGGSGGQTGPRRAPVTLAGLRQVSAIGSNIKHLIPRASAHTPSPIPKEALPCRF